MSGTNIYNSRNYSILLNANVTVSGTTSTTVEIILYYLTVITVDTTSNLQQ